MTILTSLVKVYDRLSSSAELSQFGYARVEVGFCVVLRLDGSVAFDPVDLRASRGKKRFGPRMDLPSPLVQRTSGVKPNFLWDKTEYSLGVTNANSAKSQKKFASFFEFHREVLHPHNDEGFKAFLNFLDLWRPEQFRELGWPEEMIDTNIIFALETEYRQRYLHQRPVSVEKWKELMVLEPALETTCLVVGEKGRTADSHPPIKGVSNAQSSGAFIVSFNSDAYQSYGHTGGDNAPVSETAAFKYTTVLNRFLERDSGHRVQIGDASTVFWADATDMKAAKEAESLFTMFIEPEGQKGGTAEDDKAATRDIDIHLKRIREGLPLSSIEPELAEGVRFYVLGLAPNAARLSVRFFFADTFGALTKNYQRFLADMRIDPPPQEGYPPLWRYLQETAVLGKRDNVPPNLAGEWMRAILSGTRYPLTLLSSVLMRIRSDGHINARRVSILKAVLIRNFNREAPVALDPDNTNKGYLLGRLFAVYEQIQTAALGSRVNATVKDKFYGSASAQPRKAFALLESGSANHLSKIGKQKPGYKVNLEKTVAGIMEQMSPGSDPFPASLNAEEQALFGLGYYHQRNAFFKKPAETAETNGESEE